jgi:release factor glutamine methyltransferase
VIESRVRIVTARRLLEEAAAMAGEAHSDATAWDAKILLADAVGRRNPLAVGPSDEVPAVSAERFREAWRRRVGGEPVQHILGEWDFYGRPFRVDPRALIPRPETEILVAAALAEAASAGRLLDAGTGSGILAITLLAERPSARAVALDCSVEALALARANARRLGVASRLTLAASDWLSAFAGARFDLAVSNPPYLAGKDSGLLAPTVRDHEPPAALYGGEDGLDAIRLLLDELPRFLAPGAPLLCEIGYGQGAAVESDLGRRRPWRLEKILPDHAGIPRVVVARLRAPV